MDARGRHQRDWVMYHARYVALWDTRADRIVTTPLVEGIMDSHDPYMQWNRHITRRFMTPPLQRDDLRYQITTGTTQILVR